MFPVTWYTLVLVKTYDLKADHVPQFFFTHCDTNQLGHGNIMGQEKLGKQIEEFVSPGAEI